jgi:hypothetical protein
MELFPLTKCGSIDTPDPDTPENTILKFKIAYKIFSLWQELLLSQKLIDMEQNAYLCIFLQKAHSKELQEIWQTTRLDFNCNTQTFGDLLFKYASNIKQQTPEHYIRAAKKLQCDKCYLKLIE